MKQQYRVSIQAVIQTEGCSQDVLKYTLAKTIRDHVVDHGGIPIGEIVVSASLDVNNDSTLKPGGSTVIDASGTKTELPAGPIDAHTGQYVGVKVVPPKGGAIGSKQTPDNS